MPPPGLLQFRILSCLRGALRPSEGLDGPPPDEVVQGLVSPQSTGRFKDAAFQAAVSQVGVGEAGEGPAEAEEEPQPQLSRERPGDHVRPQEAPAAVLRLAAESGLPVQPPPVRVRRDLRLAGRDRRLLAAPRLGARGPGPGALSAGLALSRGARRTLCALAGLTRPTEKRKNPKVLCLVCFSERISLGDGGAREGGEEARRDGAASGSGVGRAPGAGI